MRLGEMEYTFHDPILVGSADFAEEYAELGRAGLLDALVALCRLQKPCCQTKTPLLSLRLRENSSLESGNKWVWASSAFASASNTYAAMKQGDSACAGVRECAYRLAVLANLGNFLLL